MAVGDVTCEIVSIAAGANHDLQPVAGAVFIMVECGCTNNNLTNNLYNGTITHLLYGPLFGRVWNLYGGYKPLIDPNTYLRQHNGDAVAVSVVLSYYEYT